MHSDATPMPGTPATLTVFYATGHSSMRAVAQPSSTNPKNKPLCTHMMVCADSRAPNTHTKHTHAQRNITTRQHTSGNPSKTPCCSAGGPSHTHSQGSPGCIFATCRSHTGPIACRWRPTCSVLQTDSERACPKREVLLGWCPCAHTRCFSAGNRSCRCLHLQQQQQRHGNKIGGKMTMRKQNE